jgi:hypothetical protein
MACHSPPEHTRIIRRYARKLVAGRYRLMRDAAERCVAELNRLPARLSSSNPPYEVGQSGRSFSQVHELLSRQLQQWGMSWSAARLTPSETEVVSRYANDLVNGVYSGARHAAAACHKELLLLPAGQRRLRPRSVGRIYLHVVKTARGHGWTPSSGYQGR